MIKKKEKRKQGADNCGDPFIIYTGIKSSRCILQTYYNFISQLHLNKTVGERSSGKVRWHLEAKQRAIGLFISIKC